MRICPQFLLLLTLILPATSWCEQAQFPPPPSQHQPSDPDEETRAKLEKDMAKKRNEERQAQLKRDTDHLLKLSQELKDYVDKTNEHILSLDVLKKADEIEKLAHSVKEKMKADN